MAHNRCDGLAIWFLVDDCNSAFKGQEVGLVSTAGTHVLATSFNRFYSNTYVVVENAFEMSSAATGSDGSPLNHQFVTLLNLDNFARKNGLVG